MMNQLGYLITDRVVELVDEANHLQPDSPVTFEAMTDEQLLQTSGGAAVVGDNAGNIVVYLDPSRATEYMVAHEIMHLILHRSGWPQMWCIIPESIDPFARRLADGIDSFFDHYLFDPRLEASGFDVKGHRENYLSFFQDWPTMKITGPSVLWNALKILNALLWGADYRDRVLEITSSRQPESSDLARQLLHRASRAKAKGKSSIRSAMVEVLDYLEEWTTKQSGSVQNLRQRIGISPIFTKAQLRAPASRTVGFESHPLTINSKQLWLGGLVFKADDTRFRNYTCVDAVSEPPEFEEIGQSLQTLTLEEFIQVEGIQKYSTFS